MVRLLIAAGIVAVLMRAGAEAEPQLRAERPSVSVLSNHDLLRALTTSPPPPGVDRDEATSELVRRQAVDDLLEAFSHPDDEVQQWSVARALREIGGPGVARRMKAFASTETTLTAYLALYHLANQGDQAALATLNRNYFQYPISSAEWAEAVGLFGKFRFKAAAPNLVKSLGAASLNLVEAAEKSLGEMFPEDRKEFDSLEEMQKHWSEVVARKGRTAAGVTKPSRGSRAAAYASFAPPT